jgi:hypothetical protein
MVAPQVLADVAGKLLAEPAGGDALEEPARRERAILGG